MALTFWKDKNVLVTGGAGFIGSHLVDSLVNAGSKVKIADSMEKGSAQNILDSHRVELIVTDLTKPAECIKACSNVEVVMNLAAKVAGVAYNSDHPGDMFQANTGIGLNMLEAARKLDVSRFLVVSSACVYRRNATVPTPESEGFVGDPEPSNLGYGWAKRILELQARLYAQEYGMAIGIVRPFNTYGPRDHFDTRYGHVIPSLIKKAMKGEDPITVWGDGSQTRSFVYVTDVVQGMLLTTEKYAVADPVNLGSAEELSIAELARMVVRVSGRNTRLQFDPTKPSGQPRRVPSTIKAREKLDFKSQVSLEEGLKKTVTWYETRIQQII